MAKKINPTTGSPTSPALKIAPNGLLVIASRGRVITPEMIKQVEEDDLNQEIDRMLSLNRRPLRQESPD
jgi:hypothetical protein